MAEGKEDNHFMHLKMTQFAEYSKFELRCITKQLIDNWWNELHTCSEKQWTRWDSQASQFNSDFKDSLIIFCQRGSAIYLQCNYITFYCSNPVSCKMRGAGCRESLEVLKCREFSVGQKCGVTCKEQGAGRRSTSL